jgi:hypothetical protein
MMKAPLRSLPWRSAFNRPIRQILGSRNISYNTSRPVELLDPRGLTNATKYLEKLSGPHRFKRLEIESAN